MDALVLRHNCFKIDRDAYTVSGKDVAHGPRSVVSGDISLKSIFVGVRW